MPFAAGKPLLKVRRQIGDRHRGEAVEQHRPGFGDRASKRCIDRLFDEALRIFVAIARN